MYEAPITTYLVQAPSLACDKEKKQKRKERRKQKGRNKEKKQKQKENSNKKTLIPTRTH